jgi:NADPH:quinone reductase-like Zn-dependent oxidoreductase
VSPLELSDFMTKLIKYEIEGAALPLAILTAVVGLYSSIKLGLPQPWSPATKPTPLLIYGASSAVGYYVLQLALKSNLHPLICIAGRASAHVDKLLDKSKGDAIVVGFVWVNNHWLIC